MTAGLRQDKYTEIDNIFYPRSVAVAGVSADPGKMGSIWFRSFLCKEFKGSAYAVGRNGGEVFGMAIYPDLRSVPGPVDLVVSCIPREAVLDLLDDCAAKQVKAIQFFTAGFRETGDPKWAEVERAMVRKARQGGFRIIGPNCFGIYCPEGGVPFGPWIPPVTVGTIGYISQSGGHAGKMLEIGSTRGMYFSKIVSMGNGADLDSAEYLEYLALDPKTRIVGLYLEGPDDSRRLIDVMKLASQRKPVVVWKGGRTEAGWRATASHTGALACPASVWSGALRQAGAVEVDGLEELADTLLLFQSVESLKGSNTGIVCGLTDGGGGEAVLTADTCALVGVPVPALTAGSTASLLELLGQVGSVLGNPVDINRISGNVDGFRQTLEIVVTDPSIDILVVYENVDILSKFQPADKVSRMNSLIASLSKIQGKPVIAVLPPGSEEPRRLDVESQLAKEGVPTYPTIERAAKAIRNVNRYYRSRDGTKTALSINPGLQTTANAPGPQPGTA